jgi:membrane protease YdiL (CAAX protease family)
MERHPHEQAAPRTHSRRHPGRARWPLGLVARKLDNLPLGILVGFLAFALITLPIALMENDVTHKVYFWEIIIPGSICGLIVGYATQRSGAPATPAR